VSGCMSPRNHCDNRGSLLFHCPRSRASESARQPPTNITIKQSFGGSLQPPTKFLQFIFSIRRQPIGRRAHHDDTSAPPPSVRMRPKGKLRGYLGALSSPQTDSRLTAFAANGRNPLRASRVPVNDRLWNVRLHGHGLPLRPPPPRCPAEH